MRNERHDWLHSSQRFKMEALKQCCQFEPCFLSFLSMWLHEINPLFWLDDISKYDLWHEFLMSGNFEMQPRSWMFVSFVFLFLFSFITRKSHSRLKRKFLESLFNIVELFHTDTPLLFLFKLTWVVEKKWKIRISKKRVDCVTLSINTCQNFALVTTTIKYRSPWLGGL